MLPQNSRSSLRIAGGQDVLVLRTEDLQNRLAVAGFQSGDNRRHGGFGRLEPGRFRRRDCRPGRSAPEQRELTARGVIASSPAAASTAAAPTARRRLGRRRSPGRGCLTPCAREPDELPEHVRIARSPCSRRAGRLRLGDRSRTARRGPGGASGSGGSGSGRCRPVSGGPPRRGQGGDTRSEILPGLDLLPGDVPACRVRDGRPVSERPAWRRRAPGRWCRSRAGRYRRCSLGRQAGRRRRSRVCRHRRCPPIPIADTDAISAADVHPVAAADVDVAFDVDVAAVDGDVAAIPVDIRVVAPVVPAVPIVVVEDLVEDDGAAQDDAARNERIRPVVVVYKSSS